MLSAWRNLLKSKTYALINLFGLTLGLSVCLFISLFVRDELIYDKHLPAYSQICRVYTSVATDEGDVVWATTEGFMIPMMVSQFPEIEAGTRILKIDNPFFLRSEKENFAQEGIIAVDSTFFQVFPFEFIYGDSRTALNTPDGIVITREVAKKFFGDVDPVGKILSSDGQDFVVNGVIEDLPNTQHFHFKMAFPLKSWWGGIDYAHGASAVYSYIRLKDSTTPAEFEAKNLNGWYSRYGYVNDEGQAIPASGPVVNMKAMPIADIHLRSHAEKEFEANGQFQLVFIFIGVGIFLLVIATINYVNLSNAIAIRRAKEVAIRKTIGASQQGLFINFILESYAFTFLAFVLAGVVVIQFLPQFNLFTGKQLAWQSLFDLPFIISFLIAWLLLGFLSGSYPATILASFDPVNALKSGMSDKATSTFSLYFRKALIISQFTISAFMVVGAFTIHRQLNFIDNRNVGFNKNNVVIVPLTGEVRRNVDVLKNELRRIPGVEACAATSVAPGKRVVFLTVRIPDLAGTVSPDDNATDGTRTMRTLSVDADYIKSLGLTLLEGRNFIENSVADSAGAFIINEAAVREYNLKDPVGRPFEYTFSQPPKVGKIIGVVKDFNFASVHSPVEPLVMHIFPFMYSSLCVRLDGNNVTATLDRMEKAWKSISSLPFNYQFLDSSYDAMYRTERSTGEVITWFTVLALVIAALGLFGIVSFFATQRIKEVGVRKVFGASHISLIRVLSKEYVMMAVMGNVLAVYPAYLVVNHWLQQFAYHVELTFSSFFIAFLLCVTFAFLSVIFVILKIVRLNPTSILRHE